MAALLSRGLIRERVVDSPRKADPAMNTIWRNLKDGRGVLLFITAAGLGALGIEPSQPVEDHFSAGTNAAGESAAAAPTGADEAPVEAVPARRGRPRKAAPKARETAAPRKARGDTKQGQLIAMLRRKEGATIAQIVAAIGWQPHTVRGAFAGALKKKLGLTVTSEKIDGARVYRTA